MKVLLINGSPRKEGNTATALAAVANQLAKEGIESEIVWIGNKPIRGMASETSIFPIARPFARKYGKDGAGE